MNDNRGNDKNDKILEETREEYMTRLERWLSDVRTQNENAFKLWCAYVAQMQNSQEQNVNVTNEEDSPAPPPPPPPPPPSAPAQQTVNLGRPVFYIYVIPPMWKRIVAELIDFTILFMIKMLLTVLLLESFDVINLDNYGFNDFHAKLQNPKLAMQMSMEILTLEILHRLIVCCYETFWLVNECATPGKKYMGLVVVSAVYISPLQGQLDGIVVAHPCTPLNLKEALLRAILKNIFIGLLLPICFILLFFKYNRTGYDLMTNSLVVEYNPNPPLQQNQ